eukprot:6515819-Prymnesium_polylepis.1
MLTVWHALNGAILALQVVWLAGGRRSAMYVANPTWCSQPTALREYVRAIISGLSPRRAPPD